jgi:hypothetical protein
MSVLVYKNVFGKWRSVLDGVLGEYCRGTRYGQSTWRVQPRRLEVFMFD